jgi:hypothetical protein
MFVCKVSLCAFLISIENISSHTTVDVLGIITLENLLKKLIKKDITSRKVNGKSSSQKNYKMELSLDDIHTFLKMVKYCFHLTATAAVNNNRRTSLSSLEAAETVVEQLLHRDEAVPVAETFLWCLSHGTTNTSASSSPT